MAWWWVATAEAVECPAPVSRAEVDEALAEAEQAWTSLQDIAFRDDVDHLAGLLLPCLADPLGAEAAGRIHLLLALQLFNAGDAENAAASAASARRVRPDWTPDAVVLPPTHPLHTVWDAPLAEVPAHRVPEPRVGSVAFDGVQTRSRPDRPTVLQLFDETGVARTTSYLGAGEPLPAYAAVPHTRRALVGCAVASGAGAVGAGVVAAALRASLFAAADARPDRTAGSLDARRDAVNATTAGAWTLAAGAAGCGVGAWAIGPR